MELKEEKLRQIGRDGVEIVDYEDLTVTDDDYEEEERERFQKFLKHRKEDKELGQKYYGDERALREKEGYDDDYMEVEKGERTHA